MTSFAEVADLFDRTNFIHVSTLLGDGAPTAVPVWTGLCEGGRVGFFTQRRSAKARNVERDPRVALSVVDREDPYRMATVRGRVVDTIEGDDALAWMDAVSERYTGKPFPVRSGTVFVIEPDHVWAMKLPFEDRPQA